MRASGHWATAMFAIFSALYDSIQASRLILTAPTVSPSIRNMYNSTACFFPLLFFFFFFYKHTLILLPILSDEAIQGKKRIVCLGDRAEGWRRSCWWIGAAFYSPQCPEMLLTQVPCCSSCRDTNRLSHGRTLPAEHSPTPILPGNCQPVFLMATVGQVLADEARQSNTRSSPSFVPEPRREVTVVSMWLSVEALVCTLLFRGNN